MNFPENPGERRIRETRLRRWERGGGTHAAMFLTSTGSLASRRAVVRGRALPAAATSGSRPSSCGTQASFPRRNLPTTATKAGRGTRRTRSGRLVCLAGSVQKMTTQELEVAISSRDKPMVIDFFATWCGPCVMLSKVLEQLAAELGDNVSFVKIDTDEEVELASYFQIQGLPTLMVLGKDKGSKVLRAEGLLPADQIKQMIQEVS